MTIYDLNTIPIPKHFVPSEYPLVIKELNLLSEQFLNIPGEHKADMLISYLSNHSIRTDWVNANPEVAKMAISSRLLTEHTEKLFTNTRQQPGFRKEFEEYFNSLFRSLNGEIVKQH